MSQSEFPSPSDTPNPRDIAQASVAMGGFRAVRVRTGMTPEQVLGAVTTLSKRGRLAGFAARGRSGFFAAAHGKPFDSVLVCEVRADGAGSVIEAGVRMKRGLPWVFGVVTALCVWPGVLLTDSLMNTWFSWYPNQTWVTYAWYVPLTVLPLPWMVKKVARQSRTSAAEHAGEQVEKIRAAVDGVVDGAG